MKSFILSMFVAALVGTVAMADQAARRISVTGSGHVDVVPDMATLSLGVTRNEARADAAMAQASRAAAAMLKKLASFGIEPRDIQTRRISLNPVWSDKRSSSPSRRITGYRADNVLTVRIRDMSKVGEIIDAAAQAGGNDFGSLTFAVQDPRPLRDKARQLAVADAMAKAALLAGAAGVTLGPVVSLSEGGGAAYPVARSAAFAAMAKAAPVVAGEISVSASVSMVFAIAE